jgi:glycosyltransferase involved in cell wall biosynthesis
MSEKANKKDLEAKRKRIKARNKRIAERNKEHQEQRAKEKKSEKEEPITRKLDIEICIHCYNYQHRLCWMLSSLLQQKGDVPNLTINISHAPDNGNPTTEEVCDFFKKKGLNIVETIVTDKEVSNRAIARNRQVAQSKADWILFADSDLVYDPYFFDDLQKQLKTNLRHVELVMGADRHSLNIPFCIKYFEEDKRKYPCIIKDVAKIPEKWPKMWISGRRVAAGYFQLASVEAIKEKAGGKYVRRARDHWRGTRGDRMFRCRMGGRKGINVKPMYHLNHDRGGPEIQR